MKCVTKKKTQKEYNHMNCVPLKLKRSVCFSNEHTKCLEKKTIKKKLDGFA